MNSQNGTIHFADRLSGRQQTAECGRVLRQIPGKRFVYEGFYGGRPAVIKLFVSRLHGRRHWGREKHGLEELARRGIRTAAVLAGGKSPEGSYVLAIEKIAHAADLHTLAQLADAERTAAFEQLFIYLAQMHKAGVCQRDLHLGNFLWDGQAVFALDPAMMTFSRKPLGRSRSIQQAIRLLLILRCDSIEPVKQYFQARNWELDSEQIRAIEQLKQRMRRKLTESGLKKTMRSGRRFLAVRDGRHRGVFDRVTFGDEDLGAFMRTLDERMEAGVILKRGNTCFVSKVRLNGTDIVIKRYNHKGWVHSLRHTIKGSRARKCWLFGHRLEGLGIACAKPLAFIEQRQGGLIRQSYIINAFIDGPDIARAAAALPDDSARHRIAERTCRMLGELVRCGLTHGDLKAGNILIRNGHPVLIDLDSMQRRSCGRCAVGILWGFARFLFTFRTHKANHPDRIAALFESNRTGFSETQNGTTENNSTGGFRAYREKGWRIVVGARYAGSGLIDKILGAGTTGDDLQKVRSSDTAHVYRCTADTPVGTVGLYVKEYLPRTALDALKDLVRESRAERSFRAGLMLQESGVHTPAIAAMLLKRSVCGVRRRNILVTEEMRDARALNTLFVEAIAPGKQAALRPSRDMIAQLGRTIGRMHAMNICHGDLRGGNVFVAGQGADSVFYFIDNERTVRCRRLPARLRIKNLVQLNMLQYGIGAADRMRFFRAYAQAAGLDKSDAKTIARRVIAQTRKRLRHRARTRMGTVKSVADQWTFQRVKLGPVNGVLSAKLMDSNGAGAFLRVLDGLVQSGQVLKDDVATRVVRCTFNGCDIVIKRYNHQGRRHSVRHTIKGTRAMKSWTYGHRLMQAGVATAAPLGVLEERAHGIIRQSWIINEYVEGPLLFDVMNSGRYSDAERQAVLGKSQALLNRMGRHRLVHEDMKPANLIIHDGNPVLIDLDSMQRYRWPFYFRYRFNKMVRYFHTRMHGKKTR